MEKTRLEEERRALDSSAQNWAAPDGVLSTQILDQASPLFEAFREAARLQKEYVDAFWEKDAGVDGKKAAYQEALTLFKQRLEEVSSARVLRAVLNSLRMTLIATHSKLPEMGDGPKSIGSYYEHFYLQILEKEQQLLRHSEELQIIWFDRTNPWEPDVHPSVTDPEQISIRVGKNKVALPELRTHLKNVPAALGLSPFAVYRVQKFTDATGRTEMGLTGIADFGPLAEEITRTETERLESAKTQKIRNVFFDNDAAALLKEVADRGNTRYLEAALQNLIEGFHQRAYSADEMELTASDLKGVIQKVRELLRYWFTNSDDLWDLLTSQRQEIAKVRLPAMQSVVRVEELKTSNERKQYAALWLESLKLFQTALQGDRGQASSSRSEVRAWNDEQTKILHALGVEAAPVLDFTADSGKIFELEDIFRKHSAVILLGLETLFTEGRGNEPLRMGFAVSAEGKLSSHLPRAHRSGIAGALQEAIQNAVVHGNQKKPGAIVMLRWSKSQDGLKIDIADEGTPWFLPSTPKEKTESEMRALMAKEFGVGGFQQGMVRIRNYLSPDSIYHDQLRIGRPILDHEGRELSHGKILTLQYPNTRVSAGNTSRSELRVTKAAMQNQLYAEIQAATDEWDLRDRFRSKLDVWLSQNPRKFNDRELLELLISRELFEEIVRSMQSRQKGMKEYDIASACGDVYGNSIMLAVKKLFIERSIPNVELRTLLKDGIKSFFQLSGWSYRDRALDLLWKLFRDRQDLYDSLMEDEEIQNLLFETVINPEYSGQDVAMPLDRLLDYMTRDSAAQNKWYLRLERWSGDIVGRLTKDRSLRYYMNKSLCDIVGDKHVPGFVRLIEMYPRPFLDQELLRAYLQMNKSDDGYDDGEWNSWFILQTIAEAAAQQGLVFPDFVYREAAPFEARINSDHWISYLSHPAGRERISQFLIRIQQHRGDSPRSTAGGQIAQPRSEVRSSENEKVPGTEGLPAHLPRVSWQTGTGKAARSEVRSVEVEEVSGAPGLEFPSAVAPDSRFNESAILHPDFIPPHIRASDGALFGVRYYWIPTITMFGEPQVYRGHRFEIFQGEGLAGEIDFHLGQMHLSHDSYAYGLTEPAIQVYPDFGRHYSGIGRSLVSMALRMTQRFGGDEFLAKGVARENEGFYTKLGFRPTRLQSEFRFPLASEEMYSLGLLVPDIYIYKESQLRERAQRSELRQPKGATPLLKQGEQKGRGPFWGGETDAGRSELRQHPQVPGDLDLAAGQLLQSRTPRSEIRHEEIEIPWPQGVTAEGSQPVITGHVSKPEASSHEEKRPLVILFHAITQDHNRNYFHSMEKELLKQGALVLSVDLPAHGNNAGIIRTSKDAVHYIRSILQYVRSRDDVDAEKISMLGFSLGAWYIAKAMTASEIQNQIHSAVLIAPPLYDFYTTPARFLNPKLREDPVRGRRQRKFESKLHRIFNLAEAPENEPELIRHMADLAISPESMKRWDLSKMRWMIAKEDPLMRPDWATLKQTLPWADVHEIEDRSHYLDRRKVSEMMMPWMRSRQFFSQDTRSELRKSPENSLLLKLPLFTAANLYQHLRDYFETLPPGVVDAKNANQMHIQPNRLDGLKMIQKRPQDYLICEWELPGDELLKLQIKLHAQSLTVSVQTKTQQIFFARAAPQKKSGKPLQWRAGLRGQGIMLAADPDLFSIIEKKWKEHWAGKKQAGLKKYLISSEDVQALESLAPIPNLPKKKKPVPDEKPKAPRQNKKRLHTYRRPAFSAVLSGEEYASTIVRLKDKHYYLDFNHIPDPVSEEVHRWLDSSLSDPRQKKLMSFLADYISHLKEDLSGALPRVTHGADTRAIASRLEGLIPTQFFNGALRLLRGGAYTESLAVHVSLTRSTVSFLMAAKRGEVTAADRILEAAAASRSEVRSSGRDLGVAPWVHPFKHRLPDAEARRQASLDIPESTFDLYAGMAFDLLHNASESSAPVEIVKAATGDFMDERGFDTGEKIQSVLLRMYHGPHAVYRLLAFHLSAPILGSTVRQIVWMPVHGSLDQRIGAGRHGENFYSFNLPVDRFKEMRLQSSFAAQAQRLLGIQNGIFSDQDSDTTGSRASAPRRSELRTNLSAKMELRTLTIQNKSPMHQAHWKIFEDLRQRAGQDAKVYRQTDEILELRFSNPRKWAGLYKAFWHERMGHLSLVFQSFADRGHFVRIDFKKGYSYVMMTHGSVMDALKDSWHIPENIKEQRYLRQIIGMESSPGRRWKVSRPFSDDWMELLNREPRLKDFFGVLAGPVVRDDEQVAIFPFVVDIAENGGSAPWNRKVSLRSEMRLMLTENFSGRMIPLLWLQGLPREDQERLLAGALGLKPVQRTSSDRSHRPDVGINPDQAAHLLAERLAAADHGGVAVLEAEIVRILAERNPTALAVLIRAARKAQQGTDPNFRIGILGSSEKQSQAFEAVMRKTRAGLTAQDKMEYQNPNLFQPIRPSQLSELQTQNQFGVSVLSGQDLGLMNIAQFVLNSENLSDEHLAALPFLMPVMQQAAGLVRGVTDPSKRAEILKRAFPQILPGSIYQHGRVMLQSGQILENLMKAAQASLQSA